jgi:hypothetical protein
MTFTACASWILRNTTTIQTQPTPVLAFYLAVVASISIPFDDDCDQQAASDPRRDVTSVLSATCSLRAWTGFYHNDEWLRPSAIAGRAVSD